MDRVLIGGGSFQKTSVLPAFLSKRVAAGLYETPRSSGSIVVMVAEEEQKAAEAGHRRRPGVSIISTCDVLR